MSEHRKALEDIMRQCADARTYTRRTQVINNIAMRALGMTGNQRHEVHMEILDRIGEEPVKQAYLARRSKSEKKMAQYMLDQHGIEIAARSGAAS